MHRLRKKAPDLLITKLINPGGRFGEGQVGRLLALDRKIQAEHLAHLAIQHLGGQQAFEQGQACALRAVTHHGGWLGL